MRIRTRASLVMVVALAILSTFAQAAFAQLGSDDPNVTFTTKSENCHGILDTPGSFFTLKTLTGGQLIPGGTATYQISYPVDLAHVGDEFVIADCVLIGSGSDLKKYDVLDQGEFHGVVNNTSFKVEFHVSIPADAPVGVRVCNLAKTTSGPSAPQASNRKAAPACFTVGGDVRVEKHSTTAPNGDPIGGATFTVWDCNNTADNPTLQPIILTPAKSSGDIYSNTLSGGGVVHATDGYIAFSGPSGSTCKVTETAAPDGYQLPPVADRTVTITLPVGSSAVTVKFLDAPAPGSVKIVKSAPASQDSTVFHFEIQCTNPTHTYTGLTITGSGDVTQSDIPTGSSCKVVETAVPGVNNTPTIDPSGTFTVDSNQTVTVNVTNTLKPGSVTITKIAPASEQTTVFHFDLTCGETVYPLSVTGSDSVTQTGIPAGSSCQVTETGLGGTFATPTISPSGQFTVGANDSVTVTVTNGLLPGSVTITKVAPASEQSTGFHFDLTCGETVYPLSITGSDSVTQSGIPAGSSCQVIETDLPDRFNTPTIDPSAAFTVGATQEVAVTVTNTLKPGSVTITKVAPASQQSTEFHFDLTCGDTVYHLTLTGSGSATQEGIPAPASCSVIETGLGTAFNPPVIDPAGLFDLAANQAVTVRVTNSLAPGSLTIHKVAPAGTTDSFTFDVSCTNPENSYQLSVAGSGSAAQGGIPAGSLCSISEELPSGYAQPSYDPASLVTIGAAQSVSVTVTNSRLPLGISIVKTANPISGSPGTTVTYTYDVTNTGQVDLLNVSVDDDKLGHIGDIALLAVGETKHLTATTTLGSSAVTNVGTAVGHDRFGREAKASDDASVTVVLGVHLGKTGSDLQIPFETSFAFLGIGWVLVAIAKRRRPLEVPSEDE
jgi:uncharacterized protein DUF5979